MATIVKRTNDKEEVIGYQAKIRRKGYPPQSQTFNTKKAAEKWARDIEGEMDHGIFVSRTEGERTTFADAADRYRREVLPEKRGKTQDGYRLKALVEEFGSYSLAAITSSMLATFRDKRLTTLSPQSVVHDLNLLSRVFRAATIDWGIALPAGIPTATVRKPSINNERTRRLVGDEEARLLAAIDDLAHNPSTKRNVWTGPVVRFALETAARQSEILSLDWKDVEDLYVRVRGIAGGVTKNNDAYREVPLSPTARKILGELKQRNGKVVKLPQGKVFNTSASAIKQSWERAVDRARATYEREMILEGLLAAALPQKEAEAEVRKVRPLGGRGSSKPPRKETRAMVAELAEDPLLVDLHFHDLRHEATSRLAEKLQMHELMKVTGHKSARMLARYYHPRAEDLAKKLG